MYNDNTKQCLHCSIDVTSHDNFCEDCCKKILERFIKMIPDNTFYNEFYDFDEYAAQESYLHSRFCEIAESFDPDEWEQLWRIIDGWSYERLMKEVS